MMHELVERTRAMLHQGSALCITVDDELRVTLDLFRKGGEAVLDGIAAQNYDVLRGRPVVTRRKKLMLLGGAFLDKLRTRQAAGVRAA
jgi:phytoene/squalene synthetase